MKRFIVQIDNTSFDKEVTADNLREALYHGMPIDHIVFEVPETNQRADGTPRMTTAQRDKLWDLCGRYNVPFRETDYYPYPVGDQIFYEGWVGGLEHALPKVPMNAPTIRSIPKPKTIYVSVEPNGDSHS